VVLAGRNSCLERAGLYPSGDALFMWGWNIAAFLGMFWNWAHGSLTKVVGVT